NSRPITYLSDDLSELSPLTPNSFLQEQRDIGVPDLDAIDSSSLNKRIAYRQKLRENLRQRFRTEYLGQLKLSSKGKKNIQVRLNEIVLIGNDQDKRIDWPLGRITEIFPGKDRQVRLVRLKTAKGIVLRPIQRLYPLECLDSIEENLDNKTSSSPSGVSSDLNGSLENEHCDSTLNVAQGTSSGNESAK
ncbi:hypothetical protein PPYR_15512, partial [Photinus pyralis]